MRGSGRLRRRIGGEELKDESRARARNPQPDALSPVRGRAEEDGRLNGSSGSLAGETWPDATNLAKADARLSTHMACPTSWRSDCISTSRVMIASVAWGRAGMASRGLRFVAQAGKRWRAGGIARPAREEGLITEVPSSALKSVTGRRLFVSACIVVCPGAEIGGGVWSLGFLAACFCLPRSVAASLAFWCSLAPFRFDHAAKAGAWLDGWVGGGANPSDSEAEKRLAPTPTPRRRPMAAPRRGGGGVSCPLRCMCSGATVAMWRYGGRTSPRSTTTNGRQPTSVARAGRRSARQRQKVSCGATWSFLPLRREDESKEDRHGAAKA
ncbi:hypothetical protein B0J12DRAFT_670107 [Macrophomina phaseolina]|uniref:Uncharacterized protein n=1 Tax=Macrophomina phaseolina TaxID=35725 RepID=A0ABQ8G5D9_9PEZI|nr:hypothetical protein B0J12DRAFT_670107 [Macrophomina phaseolina]